MEMIQRKVFCIAIGGGKKSEDPAFAEPSNHENNFLLISGAKIWRQFFLGNKLFQEVL
jgi:hypothetical protein